MKALTAIGVATILTMSGCSAEKSAAPSTCKPTPGRPVQGSSALGAGTPWSVRLGPGGEVPATVETIAIASRGQPLTVSGVVFREDCVTPVPGATIHAWQVNSEGDYGPARNDGGTTCCYLQGAVRTGPSGQYELLTIVPPHYRDRYGPGHIHFEIVHPLADAILTELQFASDPYASSGPEAVVVELTKTADGAQARFDIVLRER